MCLSRYAVGPLVASSTRMATSRWDPSAPDGLRDKFYSYDGTWRTAEPSWRYILDRKQNVRGSTNWKFPLHDPAADFNAIGVPLGVRHPRGPEPAEPPTTALAYSTPAIPKYGALNEAAELAASAMFTVSRKDQKMSGWATQTLTHTDYIDPDTARWGKLGIMTRERMQVADKFGDIAVPHPSRVTTAPMRPAPPEKTGFTRGAATHGAHMLTGGFVYVEPEVAVSPAPDPYSLPERISGRKMTSGFAIGNNELERTSPPVDAESHYMISSIGYPGANFKVDKYGDLVARSPTLIDLAAARGAKPVDGAHIKVETSGFTRTKTNPSAGAVPDLIRTAERELHPTQVLLRKMNDPIECTDPHAHKMRTRH